MRRTGYLPLTCAFAFILIGADEPAAMQAGQWSMTTRMTEIDATAPDAENLGKAGTTRVRKFCVTPAQAADPYSLFLKDFPAKDCTVQSHDDTPGQIGHVVECSDGSDAGHIALFGIYGAQVYSYQVDMEADGAKGHTKFRADVEGRLIADTCPAEEGDSEGATTPSGPMP